MKKTAILFALILLVSCSQQSDFKINSTVPDLTMPNNGLKFKEIENYKNYKIVATHFRTDKQELRYILANNVAFKAFISNTTPFPEGSKIVKIGWKVKNMSNFPVALEADTLQRVEYMIKDSKRFPNNPGHWGYARFVKKDGKYFSWNKGTMACISCHNLAGKNDYVFTFFQKLE